MIRACLSASHRIRRTTRIVTTPFSAAPSATVANSSSDKRHRSGEAHPDAVLRRQAKRGDRRADGLGRLASGLEIAVVEHRLDVDEAPQLGRLRRLAGYAAVRQEKDWMLSLQVGLHRVGDGGERRLDVLERRLAVANALDRLRDRSEDAAQRRIGGERAEKRLRLDQLGRVSAARRRRERNKKPLRAKNSPPSGRLTVRMTSFRCCQRLDQRVRRLLRAFRRRRVDDGDDQVGPLREQRIEPDLLLAPGQRARQEFARVGGDREMTPA